MVAYFVGMAKQNKKRELAYDLFINTNKTQKEICGIVGVAEKTFRDWKTKGNWEEMRGAHLMTREKTVKMMFQQIHQIKQAAENEERQLTPAECDQIYKISNTIDKLDKKVQLSHYIEVFENFQGWLVKYAPDLSKQLINYMDEFVNIKADELNNGKW